MNTHRSTMHCLSWVALALASASCGRAWVDLERMPQDGGTTLDATVELDASLLFSDAARCAPTDVTCDGIDDDCDGQNDEDFGVMSSRCGLGACAATGQQTCVNGTVLDTCVASSPMTTVDDAMGPGNELDDDCDGLVDEDVSACVPMTTTYSEGVHTIAVHGSCRTLLVRLWGGGGGAGQNFLFGAGGSGGAGGYAEQQLTVDGPITLHVGAGGGSNGCLNGGAMNGSNGYRGGNGGGGPGKPGADGVTRGGAEGDSAKGYKGGPGSYGGGGGGEGRIAVGNNGNGGGGGGATVVLIGNAIRAAAGGGGGGGGGANGVAVTQGSDGGSGCSGNGEANRNNGGGGGGGGLCVGATTSQGEGRTPANAKAIPNNRATGGGSSCVAGGGGYAIITLMP